jgi:hypothetical protein
MTTSNGHQSPYHAIDADLDQLYSWFPPQPPAAPPCPEALFSATIKGFLDGCEVLLTARGQTAAEFTSNLQAVRGILDRQPTEAPRSPQEAPERRFCAKHGVELKEQQKGNRRWFSHYDTAAGTWCRGKE